MISIPLDNSQWGRDFYATLKNSLKEIEGTVMSSSIIETLEPCCKKKESSK